MKDIFRVAAAVPRLVLGDVAENEKRIAAKIKQAADESVGVLVFPECALTGATCGDLFWQETLLEETRAALCRLAAKVGKSMLVAVGAPLRIEGCLYNTAVWMTDGHVIAVIPKANLSCGAPYDERRFFAAASSLRAETLYLGQEEIPCGRLLIETAEGLRIGTVLGDDMQFPLPASCHLAMAGAELICDLSASYEACGRRAARKNALRQYTNNLHAACVYVSSGMHESGADLLFGGHGMAVLCGDVQAESPDLFAEDYLLISDIDVGALRAGRLRAPSFTEACQADEDSYGVGVMEISAAVALSAAPTYLKVSKNPFLPEDAAERDAVCLNVFDMQAHALARRLEVTGGRVVVGVSGGLDSTLALLVACRTMDILSLPRTNIYGLTLPCFGTSDRTHDNAWQLMSLLGITADEVKIGDSVLLHFRDIGQDPENHDVTYENSQARERTQVLMDYANRVGAIVLGTGDLSELALGWCTYNGDHMSMYAVNCGVPKTMMRPIIAATVKDGLFIKEAAVLSDIMDTPVSPELLPPDESGKIAQKTEDVVGPYALHDFFLYHVLHEGFAPEKIEALANIAFGDEYDGATVHRWLVSFYRRFFSQQFKRNCMPDGVKVGLVGVSPRGDLSMPSDATAKLWLSRLEQ